MLLHYQSVITLSSVFITLTGDYYIIGCISTLMFSSTCSTFQLPRVVRLLSTSVANRNYAGLFQFILMLISLQFDEKMVKLDSIHYRAADRCKVNV